MSLTDWLYENDPETSPIDADDLNDFGSYDGLADPTRFRWDLRANDHSEDCNGDHSDVSGRCETDPIE